MAIEDYSRAPDYVTKQDHLPTKWIRGHLFQEGGEGCNHSKLADKGRVCLFVYLWGGGGGKADILHLHFIFTFYILHYILQKQFFK